MPQGPRAVLNGRKLEYKWPFMDTAKGSRTAKFEPIGEDATEQILGADVRTFTIDGHAHYADANFIESIERGAVVSLVHYRGSGDIKITDTSSTPEGGTGGKPGRHDERRFRYTIEAVEASPGSFTFRTP